MIHTRRKFLTGLGSLLASPAIVHAGNLMPVKALQFSGNILDGGGPPLSQIYGHSPFMELLRDLEEMHRRIRSVYELDFHCARQNWLANTMEPK